MRRSPLFSAFFYMILGCVFTAFAVHEVRQSGWGFFSYLLVLLATFDFGSGLRLLLFYLKYKDQLKK